MNVKHYVKKPAVIEAVLVDSGNVDDVAHWCGGQVSQSDEGIYGVKIKTLEGTMLANDGDYIICGVKGEFYPCKADIFDMTYEEILEAA